MTNKEAIEYLKDVKWHIDLEMSENTQKMYDAIDMAISKLQANDEQVSDNNSQRLVNDSQRLVNRLVKEGTDLGGGTLSVR